MTVDVILTAGDVAYDKVKNKNVAVVDVFRATSVIVEALKPDADKGKQKVIGGGEDDGDNAASETSIYNNNEESNFLLGTQY